MMSNSSLLQFLKYDIKMHRNYQPIVIKMLLESENHISSIPEIKNKFQELNFDRGNFNGPGERPLGHTAIDSVKKVFSDGKLISFPEGTSKGDVKLIDNKINESEIKECLKICGEKILQHHVDDLMKKENQCYFIRPGKNGEFWKEFRTNNFVAVDYLDQDNPESTGDFDLSGLTKDEISKRKGNTDDNTELFDISQIKKGDIIAIVNDLKTIEEFAIATSNYYFKNSVNKNKHSVNVEYLNFGTSEIGNGVRKGIMKDTQNKIKDFLTDDDSEYFLLRHNSKGPWKDDSGKKYHLGRDSDGRMGKRVRQILDAGVGTKTIWYSTSKDEFYFWGYGTVTGIEEKKKDSEWYLTYDDFKFFKGDTNIQGRELTRATTSVNQQLQDLQNDKEWKFNWQLAINPISKKLYQEIIGEDLTSEDDEIDSMNQGNFDPKLEKLYEILKRKKQIIFYGPPGTGKTYSANKLKKYILSKNTPQPISSNSKNWIYSVDPENWEIVKTHHIWASSVPIEKIRERINQNDNVIFFVTGTKKFQGIFKFSSDWYTAKSVVWPDETNEVRYLSQIKLEPILLGDLNLWDIAKNLEYFPDPENKRDSSLKLQGRGGYPSNKESLSRKDFETICSHMRSIGSSTNDQNFSKNVTFHQSYSYEDFVEGIRPDITSSDKVIYKPQDGIFKEICESARKDPQNNYVLTIDEINRGNVSKIFGELITLIESDKRKEEHKVTLPYTRQSFWIPKNLFIIGTMNTADRSIAQLDTALRRRFAFEELMPEYTLKDLDKSIDGISLKDLLSTLNSRIRDQGPQFRDKQIGHSYFMDDCKNIEDLRTIFAVEIIPLLQDYFYHDYKKLEDKILNSNFIDSLKDDIKSDWKNDDEIFKAAINKILTSD